MPVDGQKKGGWQMHPVLRSIPEKILESAQGALAQANTHAAFFDPGNEHWGNMSVLNAAHAGELVMKAMIADTHPLLVFKNVFDLDDGISAELDISRLLAKAKAHDFQHLPAILWAVRAIRIPDKESFDRLRLLRNAIQHFYHPEGVDDLGEAARDASLNFIYNNIDPLLNEYFGLYAIEFHEDHHVGYDYLVGCLIAREQKFSMPPDFDVGEIDIEDVLSKTGEAYQSWFRQALSSSTQKTH